MSLKSIVLKVLVLPVLLLPAACHSAEVKPLIQVAIILDTSNSMDGLINQAKSQLWKIVNEFATVKKNGKTPELQVSLFEYGNNGLSAQNGYMRMVLPFTGDLDKISEELFALRTNGGSEYCGKVIKEASEKLEWSGSNENYRAIFIAGNEPFTQGEVDYKTACKKAIKKGIIVNTIHCGSYEEGNLSGWKDGAELADGTYANIDQDKTVAYMETPHDKEIEKLGAALNRTYIAYGKAGSDGKRRQEEQEKNAIGVTMESFISRQVAKSSPHYNNSRWDLVDAVEKKFVGLDKLKKDELPEEMRNMSMKEKNSYIEKLGRERKTLQQKIKVLNDARQKYINEKMASSPAGNRFDDAVVQSVRKQAEKKAFIF